MHSAFVRFSIISLLTWIFSINISEAHDKVNLRNKYIVYSADKKTNAPFFKNQYYVTYNDTVFAVDGTFGYKDTVRIVYSPDDVRTEYYTPKAIPMLMKRNKDTACFYNAKSTEQDILKSFPLKQYRNKAYWDDFEKNLGEGIQLYRNVYTGIDTIITACGQEINCKKYARAQSLGEQYILTYTYFDEGLFIPVRVETKAFDSKSRKLSYVTTEKILFILERNDVKSKEFDY